MQKEYLNVKEISELLGIGRTKTYILIHTKGFPKIKIGRSYIIPKNEFDQWIKQYMNGNINLC